MGDIAQRGNRLTNKHISKDLVRNVYEHVAPKHSPGQKGKPHSSKEGRTASIGRTVRDTMKILTGAERDRKFGGGRTNLLEQLGRVEAEPSNPNRRAEISRVHGELNRGYAKGGRAGYALGSIVKRAARKFRPGVFKKGKKTHGKDVPTMAAEGGRIGLKKGGKPWGTGPKPGTLEFLQTHTQTPKRKGKAAGSIVRNIPKLLKKFKKKKVYPETEDLTHQKGPYVGDVGSEGKRRKAGPRGKGKPPGSPAPGPKGRRPWRDAIPGRPSPGTPAPKWKRPIDKFPPPKRKSIPPIGKFPPEKGKWQKAAEGGRIGLKKGGSDKKWIQKAVNPKHKGYCTPMTKKTCTPARKALARTFKKKAKTGWG